MILTANPDNIVRSRGVHLPLEEVFLLKLLLINWSNFEKPPKNTFPTMGLGSDATFIFPLARAGIPLFLCIFAGLECINMFKSAE